MKEIIEDYCDFETAKLLKEKGFNADTEHDMWYVVEKFSTGCHWNSCTYKVGDITREYDEKCCIVMPTLQMAMKWLREVHKLFIDITAAMEDYIEDGVVKYKDPYYTWEVFSLEIGETLCFGEAQNVKESYEAACDSAIKYCLKNLV